MSCCQRSGVTSLLLAAAAGGAFALIGSEVFSQSTKDLKDAGKQAVKDAKDAAKHAADKAKEAMGGGAGAGGQPEMSPEMMKMMQAWGEYMTPGEPHALLARQVGTWHMKSKMRMDPGAPFEESEGTTEIKSIMGGRYFLQHVSGPGMGGSPVPFEGMNLMGYDNFKKKHFFCWIDNMGTGLFIGEGEASADGKTITYFAEGPDLVTGKTKKVRGVNRFTSDDAYSFEMYDWTPDGKEYLGFTSEYTRVK